MELMRQSWQMPHPIRMLTVTALNLVEEAQYSSQIDLFAQEADERSGKLEKLEHTMDHIRAKYGTGAISYATSLAQQKKTQPDNPPEDRD